jgi:hypothetical protein
MDILFNYELEIGIAFMPAYLVLLIVGVVGRCMLCIPSDYGKGKKKKRVATTKES